MVVNDSVSRENANNSVSTFPHICRSYSGLPDHLFQKTDPVHVSNPHLIAFNTQLARQLGFHLDHCSQHDLAAYFSGNILLPESQPLAMAYAGHQFGSFVPQLGDGRAHLLGEVESPIGHKVDIQLKGSGPTRFSRGGDGRSPLGPVIREYIISEAMYHLDIPTTRALAMVSTEEKVSRYNGVLPAGILTRTASGFIRIGTFEYLAARHDTQALQNLADYVIDRHYPAAKNASSPYLSLLAMVAEQQAKLVAQWMCIGFIHGVMNTDNTLVSGETIDYGPCAFMDHYNPNQVFSSIDIDGRYRFKNQGTIMAWNLGSFAGCLVPLLDDEKQAHISLNGQLERFASSFLEWWKEGMVRKIGLTTISEQNILLVQELLDIMAAQQADYTCTFRFLADNIHSGYISDSLSHLFSEEKTIGRWLEKWQRRMACESRSYIEIQEGMNAMNPAYIPRNHIIERAIRQAEDHGDFSETYRLIKVLAAPFSEKDDQLFYAQPPRQEERVLQTFCGT